MNGVALLRYLTDLSYVLFTVIRGATLIVGHQRHLHLKMKALRQRQQEAEYLDIIPMTIP